MRILEEPLPPVAASHTDTVSADFLSYPDPTGRAVGRRCGTLRTATVDLNHR